MRPVVPSRKIVLYYALIWVTAYVLLFGFFKDFLPIKYFRDFYQIELLTKTADASDWGGAFVIAAFMMSHLPLLVINGMVMAVGCTAIWIIINSLRTYRGMIMIVPVLIPMIVLDLLSFGKESFVVPLTLVLLGASTRINSRRVMFCVILAVYLIYGVFFRQYYLLILGLFVGFTLFVESKPVFWPILIALPCIALLVAPSHVFMDAQGPRDQINFYANIVWNQIRTSIYNPYPPDTWYHFIANYVYTFLRLNFPVLFMLTSSDIILFTNIVLYGRLLGIGLVKKPKDTQSYLAWMFLAHVMILWIFEPDSGSYFRHFSSVFMYLVPALRIAENRTAAYLQQRQMERYGITSGGRKPVMDGGV